MCWWCWCFVWSEKWTYDTDQNVVWMHCMLERESLAAKEMSEDFADITDSILLRRVPCVFPSASLCDALGEYHIALLSHLR